MCHISAVVSETRDGATQQTYTQQTWEPAEQSWRLESLRSSKLSLVSSHGGTETHTPSLLQPQHGRCSTQTSPFFQTCRFQWSASLKRFHMMNPLHPTCLDLFFCFRIFRVSTVKRNAYASRWNLALFLHYSLWTENVQSVFKLWSSFTLLWFSGDTEAR